ncbi:MAG: hypothetical protein QOK40_2994, partial [Miltoncostaeaceae bacterium]|nr:hypothetical protein [Miltoncostaeaceae bacterium]
VGRRPAALGAAVAAASAGLAAALAQPWLLLGLAALPGSAGWVQLRLSRARRQLQEALPLDLAAHAVADAYRELGELSDGAAGSLAIEPRASGYLRVWLRQASPEESARFTSALNDLVEPAGFPRYLVSRPVPGAPSAARSLARALLGRQPFERRWVAVPADLGRRRERAEAFARAWRRWLGPSELRFTQGTEEGREALAAAAAQPSDLTVRRRRIWL